ncbi:stilbene synthase [Pusillimonas sp. ANT_WB101]|nr:stilbene synthase [Pusillimonas sp. ANT_WB101]
MYIRGVGTAVPATRYTKAQCLLAFEQSAWFNRLDARSRFIAQTVLEHENGIEVRHLALDSLDEVFHIDPDTLARRFLYHAPKLAVSAGSRALSAAKISANDIDAVVVSTCTGYLCPGLSGYVVEGLGLRADVQAYDLVGQGCAAALPNMQLGRALLATGSCAHVLSVCVEVSSAAMYLDNDPGVIVSACLFGDGAGAAVLSRSSNASTTKGTTTGTNASTTTGTRQIEWVDSSSVVKPSHRDVLKFETRRGMLRNVLTRAVPALAAEHALNVLHTVLQRAGLHSHDVNTWIMHAGGRDVLKAVELHFPLQSSDLRYSSDILRSYGNLSSAFVYFVLQAALADSAPSGYWWLSSFGAGFSCHGALLKVR